MNRKDADALVAELLTAIDNSTDVGARSPSFKLGYLSGLLSSLIANSPKSKDIVISRINSVKSRAKTA